MSLIIPDSTVNMFADVPISAGHQLVFSSRSAQNTYFLNKRLVTKAGCSYIRKTGRLRIEFNAARVQQCNYMSFTNTSFENVTFYARILDYEYVNNETTDVLYTIDYWQTYMFDAEFHACSILREHLTETDYQKAVTNPWRRDIPELLTDEGLPCDKTLEKIYNRSEYINNFSGEMTSLVNDSYTLYTIMLLSEFDFSEWSEGDKQKFLEQIEYFGGNIDPDSPSIPTNIEDLFGGFDNNFPNAIALIGFNVYNTRAVDEVLNLLTIYGVTSSVVGIYVCPDYMLAGLFNGVYKGNAIEMFNIAPAKLIGVDPKLNTYPFRYLRVLTPQDSKEYRLDLFKDLSDGVGSFKLKLVGSVNGIPRLTLYPVDYSYNDGAGNFYERVNFENFPQVSYSIDAYLTFLSGQYSQAIQSNTLAGRNAITAARGEALMSGTAARGLQTAFNIISGGLSDVSIRGINPENTYGFNNTSLSRAGDILGASTVAKINQPYADFKQGMETRNEAFGERGDYSSAVFDGTKRAYINDQYVAGGSGIYGMYAVNGVVFDLQIVTLNDDILQKYSNYLNIYGYKSLRTGRPHLCDYVTDGSNIPHFTTFDGETFTYVQTENLHVTGLQANACAAIENLFNAGCRFLKGD